MHTVPILPELNRHRKEGKKIIGCFPLYPPVELFEAMGLLPVVLWNLKHATESLNESDRHIQNYACGIARELVQFTLSESGACLDGIFSYNACDTLRNLPEILSRAHQSQGRPRPMLRIHLPQVNRSHTDPTPYLKHEIHRLIEETETAFGVSLRPEAFEETADAYRRMRKLSLHAERLVMKGAISFADFSRTVLAGYAVPVEEQIQSLSELIASGGGNASRDGIGVLVSGIMPPPMPVIRAMEEAGLRVVANDIASLRRSYGYTPPVSDDPGAYYAALFSGRFPCTTLLYQADERVDAFLNLVESSGAKGVIFSGEKFCEYEYFEFPHLEDRLREKGIPTLRLEFGIDAANSTGSYATRIGAFAEMIA